MSKADRALLAEVLVLTRAGVPDEELVRDVSARRGVHPKTVRRYLERAARSRDEPSPNVPAQTVAAVERALGRPEAPAPIKGETRLEFRIRWAAVLEDWIHDAKRRLDEGIVIGLREIGGTRDCPGEVREVYLNHPAGIRAITKAVDTLFRLVGANAPEEVHVTSAPLAGGPGQPERDPKSMSPAERRRELEELRATRARLASGEIIDVE